MKKTQRKMVKKIKHMSRKQQPSRKVRLPKKNRSKKMYMSKKIRMHKKRKTRKYKGGFGPKSNPFPQNKGGWLIDNKGNYFLFNPNGQVVGGIDPYYGSTQPEPQMTYGAYSNQMTPYQKGGMFGQGLVNLWRKGVNTLVNDTPFLGRVYRGKHPVVSPLPTVQPEMESSNIIASPLPNIKKIRNNSKSLAAKI